MARASAPGSCRSAGMKLTPETVFCLRPRPSDVTRQPAACSSLTTPVPRNPAPPMINACFAISLLPDQAGPLLPHGSQAKPTTRGPARLRCLLIHGFAAVQSQSDGVGLADSAAGGTVRRLPAGDAD